MKTTGILSTALLAGAASAHSIMYNLVVGGTTYPDGHGIRAPSYNGPIQDVNSDSIACNGPPNPTTPSSEVITVNAGSTVQGKWRHSDGMVIDASHKGPVMAYMKKVNNAASDSGVGGGWFKISEQGLNPDGVTWAVDDLISAGGLQNIPIPSCLQDGHYLLRGEIIALHAAGQPGGAQFYMECAQINVVGGSGSANPATVSLPGAYSASDPGVQIDIYWPPVTQYKIPGPPVFKC
ncbi:hypothetical protein AJ80_00426 [Polytolypa hystricis UAMH7299]|uniref:AA9 family lytic polysaccharide monooxygenase n=1 Tax=Polytolypa hystricis (strain UAMH7299) TaxID=1447883 RepID=A0A2B7Z1R7_POLH7|nr:hypothetical protein AJ80_00426 [Polytolypa hystricis UAMH7299]